uniref:Uncharacterized protein n=1 Tax=Anthurium amnicola TaxID=1678845 RepID=A0A1D1YW78_9ARAE
MKEYCLSPSRRSVFFPPLPRHEAGSPGFPSRPRGRFSHPPPPFPVQFLFLSFLLQPQKQHPERKEKENKKKKKTKTYLCRFTPSPPTVRPLASAERFGKSAAGIFPYASAPHTGGQSTSKPPRLPRCCVRPRGLPRASRAAARPVRPARPTLPAQLRTNTPALLPLPLPPLGVCVSDCQSFAFLTPLRCTLEVLASPHPFHVPSP